MTEETTSAIAAAPGGVAGKSASLAAGRSSTETDKARRPGDAGQPGGASAQDEVNIRMPADGAYLSVLRTATAGLAARLDFTLDDIEDLRIAVDEACAMLLGQAVPGSSLECSFALSHDELIITVSVPSLNPHPPAGDTFAWTVLSALAGSVAAETGPGDKLAIVMRKSRPDPGSA